MRYGINIQCEHEVMIDYRINIQCEHEVMIDCTQGSFVDMEIKATFPVLNLSNRYIQLHFIYLFVFFILFRP